MLAAGELLGIYPEGTRTPDGRLFRGKTGVARLALEARAPVIPTAMIGGFEFQPPGKLAPRLTIRPGVRFGKPLDFSRYYGLEQDRIVLRAVTDEIMYELMRLSGPGVRRRVRPAGQGQADPGAPARRHEQAREPRATAPRAMAPARAATTTTTRLMTPTTLAAIHRGSARRAPSGGQGKN